MLTNQSLAQSEPVAAAAVKQLGLSQSPGSLLAAYTALSTTDEVLQITVNAPSSTRAVDEARAIAAQFLTFRANILRMQEQQQASALNLQVTRAEQSLSTLGGQITALGGTVPSDNATAPAGNPQPATSKLGKLQAKYTAADTALSALKQQVTGTIAQNQVNATSVIDGSQVLDPAVAGKYSKLKYIGYDVVTGLFAGVVLGMALIVFQALISDRLRRRDDIATALGAPVKLSVGPIRSGRLPAGPRARAASERAVRRLSWHLRHLVQARARGMGAAGLAVIPVDNARAVAPAVIATVASCAEDGMRVIVADLAPGAPAAGLLGVTGTGIQRVHLGGAQVTVVVPDPDDLMPTGPLRTGPLTVGTAGASSWRDELERAFRQADLLLTVAELDPASGADHLGTWATDAVAIITAGRTHGQHAYAVGEMLRLAAVQVVSSVVVGADDDDDSLGLGISEPEHIAGQQ
jgi:capsular polysaccharide biosynthesis protein